MLSKFLGAFGAALAAIVALIAVSGLMACGGGGGGGGGGGAGNRGTLDVFMVDAPPDPTITSVEVDISRIEAFVGTNWTVISDSPQTIDLLDIGVTPVRVASESLPIGSYTQIRFIVTQARVTDSGGTYIATVPQSTTHINVDHDITLNSTTSLLLDFNVERSLVKLGPGDYLLTPVVPAVIMTEAGTITGVTNDGALPLHNAKIWAVYTAGGNYAANWPVNVSSSKVDGSFKVWALMPGTYRLDMTWDDGATTRSSSLGSVVVTANQNTDVGAQTLN